MPSMPVSAQFPQPALGRLPESDPGAPRPVAPSTRRLPAEPSRLLFPLAFCRECGQEFYLVRRLRDRFAPRAPELDAPAGDGEGEPGSLVLEEEGFFNPEEEGWPDGWVEWRNGRPRVKANYERYRPDRLFVSPDGAVSRAPRENALACFWQPRPFMICPCSRTAFDLRFERDYGKLVTLAQNRARDCEHDTRGGNGSVAS